MPTNAPQNPKEECKFLKNVVIVATSSSSMGDHKTGAWSEEITGPYYYFKDMNCQVQVVSIGGGNVPIDPASITEEFTTENDKRMDQEDGMKPLMNTKALKTVDINSVDILFFAGGHGTCVDFATDEVGGFVTEACAAGKVIAAVCHGSMALVNAKGPTGEPLVKLRKVVCFSDAEEEQVGLSRKVPFLLETGMKELGADVRTGDAWTDTVTRDGNLITGQNPQSSVSCAKLALVAALVPVNVLIVATSSNVMTAPTGSKHDTGAWMEEISGPYYVFRDRGCNVEICSISGGDVPIDQASLAEGVITENDTRMLAEKRPGPLAGTRALKDVNLEDFQLIFFAGGHGACEDYATDKVGTLVSQAHAARKVIAAVCHGVMALVKASTRDGSPLVKDKKVSCFTNDEEAAVGLVDHVPFSLSDQLAELGANIQPGGLWSTTAARDGNLVTGQNPQSSVFCATLALEVAQRGPAADFDVEVFKTTAADSLGLRVANPQGKQLFVKNIQEGLIQRWNRMVGPGTLNPLGYEWRTGAIKGDSSRPPATQVELGDRIVRVNYMHGDAEMMYKELINSRQLSIGIAKMKPTVAGDTIIRYVKTLEKERIGLNVGSPTAEETLLTVNAVYTEGYIAEWNARNHNRVEPGDLIVDVNGITGNAQSMLAALHQDPVLLITVRHRRFQREEGNIVVLSPASLEFSNAFRPREDVAWNPVSSEVILASIEEGEVKELEQRKQQRWCCAP